MTARGARGAVAVGAWPRFLTLSRCGRSSPSAVQPGHVENEDDLILPAREGALRVLRALRNARIKRVVLTEAFHAVGWGHPHDDRTFTEEDWIVLAGGDADACGKSNTLSERAAEEGSRGSL